MVKNIYPQKRLEIVLISHQISSDDYKEFCEWWRESQEGPFLPLPEKFKEHPVKSTFEVFFDVHTLDFGIWWEIRKRILELLKKTERNPIEICATQADPAETGLSDKHFAIFKEKNDVGPSNKEMVETFIQGLENEANNKLILKIDLSHEPKDIKDEFSKIMNSDVVKKKIANAKSYRLLRTHRNIKRTGQTPIEDLRKYLEIYDMWEEEVQNRKPGDSSGWARIIRHFEPHQEYNQDVQDRRRVYLRYRQNAERIISNAERGYFPGEY